MRPSPALPSAFLTVPIAHRALHDFGNGRVENSMAAVEAAAALGYGIELDVQLSKDDEAIVFHDRTLERLTGIQRAVRASSLPELAGLSLRGGPDTIRSLSDILAVIGGRVALLIEVKPQGSANDDQLLVSAVVASLATYSGDVALMSFAPSIVEQIGRRAPHLPRGLVTECESFPPSASQATPAKPIGFANCQPAFVSHQSSDVGRPEIAALRREGLGVLCWTIRSAEEEAVARRYCDNITFEGYLAATPRLDLAQERPS